MRNNSSVATNQSDSSVPLGAHPRFPWHVLQKHLATCLSVALLLALSCSSALAEQDYKRSLDYGVGMVFGDGTLPQERARINLISADVRSSISFGCNGISADLVVDQTFKQLDLLFDKIMKDANGLLMAALIYSQPTIYQFLENLNKHVAKGLSMTQLSCDSVRAIGTKHAGLVAEAKKKCLNAGMSTAECNDGNNLENYAALVVDEITAEWDRISGQAKLAANSITTLPLPGDVYGDRGTPVPAPIPSLPPNPSTVQLIGVMGGLNADDLKEFAMLMTGRVKAEDGDTIKLTERKLLASQLYEGYVGEYTNLLHGLVSNLSSGQDVRAELEGAIKADPYLASLSIDWLADMAVLQKSPTQYAYALSAVSNATAAIKLEMRMLAFERAALHGITNGAAAETLTKEDIELMNRNLDLLRTEVRMIKESIAATTQQRNVMMSISNYVSSRADAESIRSISDGE
jgi:hypothetical protein